MGIDKLIHSVYKIMVGDFVYFGYTSRDPRVRLKEHLDEAAGQKWKHNSLLYPALVESELEHTFEVIGEHPHEIPALLQEIMEIRDTDPVFRLNNSKGGEGSTVNIKIREYKNGNIQYKATLKKKPRPSKRKSRKRRRR